MATLMFHFSVLVLSAALLLPITHCQGRLCLPKEHASLFIFGDSIFDVGNNNYINTTDNFRANVYPYGETFFKYPTGRFSDGRSIPDFIAEYANLPLIPPYLFPGNQRHTDGANFASGGAGALSETYRGFVIDLKTQVSYFKNLTRLLKKNLGDTEAKSLLSRAVYLINIGSNDYFVRFTRNSSVFQSISREKYIDMVIGNLTIAIKEIYKTGGRKLGFPNMWPLGCVPSRRAQGNNGECDEQMTEIAILHYKRFSKVLQNLESQLKGFRYSLADSFTAASERIDNPSRYGFKEGKTACCGTGPFRGISSCGGRRSVKEYELCENASEYVFFDSGHPSERANQQLAEIMWSGAPDVTGPYNLKALFEL